MADTVLQLQDFLECYYEHHADETVKTSELSAEQKLINSLIVKFEQTLRDTCPMLNFGKVEFIGSAYEKLVVRSFSDFDVTFAIELSPDFWGLRKVNDVLPDFVDGLWLVTRRNAQHLPLGCSQIDTFLHGRYISPWAVKLVVKQTLITCLHSAGLEAHITESGPAVSAIITGFPDKIFDQPISLDITPYLKLQVQDSTSHISLVEKKLPFMKKCIEECRNMNVSRDSMTELNANPLFHVWRQSFHKEVQSRLAEDLEIGCRRKALLIVKALRYNCSILSVINTFQLKTVFFYMCDHQTRWRPEDLSDRVLELLRELKKWIDSGSLPSYFDRDRDLLAECGGKSRIDVSLWLKSILKSPEKNLIPLLQIHQTTN